MKKEKRRLCLIATLLSAFIFCSPQPAHADSMGLLFRGVARTLLSAFEIPRSILQDSTRVMFPLGILTGTLSGAYRTIMGTLAGGLDIARGAAPYAKYMVFFI